MAKQRSPIQIKNPGPTVDNDFNPTAAAELGRRMAAEEDKRTAEVFGTASLPNPEGPLANVPTASSPAGDQGRPEETEAGDAPLFDQEEATSTSAWINFFTAALRGLCSGYGGSDRKTPQQVVALAGSIADEAAAFVKRRDESVS